MEDAKQRDQLHVQQQSINLEETVSPVIHLSQLMCVQLATVLDAWHAQQTRFESSIHPLTFMSVLTPVELDMLLQMGFAYSARKIV